MSLKYLKSGGSCVAEGEERNRGCEDKGMKKLGEERRRDR
jgi:hypothetical protein